MRRLVRTLVVVAAIAGAAHAQPSLVPASPSTPTPVENAIEVGALFGETTAGDLATGLVLGGEHRLGHTLWLHGAAAAVTTPQLETGWSMVTSDRFSDLRGGPELRACTITDQLCALVGVDVGYRHEIFDHTMNRSGGEAVLRVGADVALVREVRLRAVFEGTSTRASDTSAMTFTVAYLW